MQIGLKKIYYQKAIRHIYSQLKKGKLGMSDLIRLNQNHLSL